MRAHIPDVWLAQGLDEVDMALHIARRVVSAVAEHPALRPHQERMSSQATSDAKGTLGCGYSCEAKCRRSRGKHGGSAAGFQEASHNDVVVLQLHGDAAARVVRAGPDIDCTPAWILLFLHPPSGLQGSGDDRSRRKVPEMASVAHERDGA